MTVFTQAAIVEAFNKPTQDHRPVLIGERLINVLTGDPLPNMERPGANAGEYEVMTARWAIARALIESYQDEAGLDGETKALRGTLALRITQNKHDWAYLHEAAIAQIRLVVGKFWSAMIVSQVYDLLDSTEQPDPDKEDAPENNAPKDDESGASDTN